MEEDDSAKLREPSVVLELAFEVPEPVAQMHKQRQTPGHGLE